MRRINRDALVKLGNFVNLQVYKVSQTLPFELRILAPLSQNSAEYVWTVPTAPGLSWVSLGKADETVNRQVEAIISQAMTALSAKMGLKPETAADIFHTPDRNRFIYYAKTGQGLRVCITGWGFRFVSSGKPSEIKIPEIPKDNTDVVIEVQRNGTPVAGYQYEIYFQSGVHKPRITDSQGRDNLGKVKVGSIITLIAKSGDEKLTIDIIEGKSLYKWDITPSKKKSEEINKDTPEIDKEQPDIDRDKEKDINKDNDSEKDKNPVKDKTPGKEKDKDKRGDDPVRDKDPGKNPSPKKPGRTPVKKIPKPVPGTPKPIINPEDPVKYIDAGRLMVLINPGSDDRKVTMDRFQKFFKQAYPSSACSIEFSDIDTMLVMLSVPASNRAEIRHSLNSKIPSLDFYIEYVEVIGLSANNNLSQLNFTHDGQWYYDAVEVREAWNVTLGKGVKVAVIDDYFDLSHRNFEGLRIDEALSLERTTDDVSPKNPDNEYHGTHVLGIIASQLKQNGNKVVGISPSVTVMPISLGNEMTNFKVLYGILYVLYRGAQVINLSLGVKWSDEAKKMSIKEQVSYAESKSKDAEGLWDYVFRILDERNCTIVYASGNENLYTLMDSAKRWDNLMLVDAVDNTLHKASFSNFANIPSMDIHHGDVSAPGVKILNLIPEDKYAIMDGTSMAAPIVTAAIALMKSVDPSLTNVEIKDAISATARKLPEKEIGPLLQISSAVDYVKNMRGGWHDFYRQHVGIWKTTDKFSVYQIESKKWEADCHQYIIFHTHDSGILELHAQGENRIWNTRFEAKILPDSIILDFQPQLDLNGSIYLPDRLVLKGDSEGNVVIQFFAKEEPNVKKHNIRFIKNDDRRNTARRKI